MCNIQTDIQMKKLIFVPIVALLLSCGGGEHKPVNSTVQETTQPAVTETKPDAPAPAADAKGIGKFKTLALQTTIDQAMATHGKDVYNLKCASCHRTDDKKLVGPGWKGVTTRRTPEWIMNFITNTDENLNKDPQSMSLLEECLVRMPNQNLSDKDARDVLEFMRLKDSVK